MKVCVRLFAAAREHAGCDAVEVRLDSGQTVADVRRALERDFPPLAQLLRHSTWAVDARYADSNETVHERSDIALIPPVSGG